MKKIFKILIIVICLFINIVVADASNDTTRETKTVMPTTSKTIETTTTESGEELESIDEESNSNVVPALIGIISCVCAASFLMIRKSKQNVNK